ncbi:hypothetical protein [Nitrosomonas sp. Nm34]|uniref:hypothetical protein n=1 Tax=Nitrosomonas sp. Nm34 TaxID=1881055 RepID=UPI0008ED5C46|nr:hypothetical protein [Nitrosomonas sp. Nm34]SFI97784.1 hypothetical protein SAMN05428978_10729 [Nitrosomonas sp. Nm34]
MLLRLATPGQLAAEVDASVVSSDADGNKLTRIELLSLKSAIEETAKSYGGSVAWIDGASLDFVHWVTAKTGGNFIIDDAKNKQIPASITNINPSFAAFG